jgi:Flp pilus assembly protein TadD
MTLAEAMWRAAMKIKPNDAEIKSGLAGALAELGKYPEAITVLRSAIEVEPRTRSSTGSWAASTASRATTRRPRRS